MSKQIARLRAVLRWPAWIAVGCLVAILLLALAWPFVAPHAPEATGVGPTLQGPTWAHPFGTDQLGRDQLSRVIAAARPAVISGFVPSAVALLVGMAIGATAGYMGGATETLVMRFVDVMYAFPGLMLAIVLVGVFGPGVSGAVVAISFILIPRFARLARSTTLSVRGMDFIDSARLSGVSSPRIILRHIVPNIVAPLIVMFALMVSVATLIYAALSFLGLGLTPPDPDWGSMLSTSRNYMTLAPWLTIFPGIALVVFSMSANFVADALRDVLAIDAVGGDVVESSEAAMT